MYSHIMKYVLVEWDTGNVFGPAGTESVKLYEQALGRGTPYFLYPYFGYHLKMWVKKEAPDRDGTEASRMP